MHYVMKFLVTIKFRVFMKEKTLELFWISNICFLMKNFKRTKTDTRQLVKHYKRVSHGERIGLT